MEKPYYLFGYSTRDKKGKSIVGAVAIYDEKNQDSAVVKGLDIVHKNTPGCGKVTYTIEHITPENETQFPYDGRLI